ncbi:MAG: hypothetical protein HYR56_24380 [Acidobacteria bacterium]|nr:hypothetical protein [Acidobacteriota bacterium]MBI3424072.1 hypothetical protein [Acidobacteriota bacterium]
MKNKFYLTLTTLALASALMLTALAQGRQAPPPTNINPYAGMTVTPSKKVILPCKNSGGHQDVSKNMSITNTTGKTLAANTEVFYKASDGDSGSNDLSAALAVNAQGTIHGKAGQNYTCQAWVFVK